MQWGDLSYNGDTLDMFMQGNKRGLTVDDGVLFNWNSKIRRFISNSFQEPSMIDSRFMKVKTLAQIYARERTDESLRELQEEMRSMQRTDKIFTKLISKYNLDGNYDANEINFDCLQPVIEDLEQIKENLGSKDALISEQQLQLLTPQPQREVVDHT